MEYRNPLVPRIDITKSVKLEQYYKEQTLPPDEVAFVSDINVGALFDDDTYNSIKYKTETYKKIKNNIANGMIPVEQVEEELNSLRADVLYESNGQDIETINLDSLKSAEKLDGLLRDYGASSKNDIRVKLCDLAENWTDGEFKKVEVVSSNEPYSYGILPSAKLLVLNDGTIITKNNSLYRK